MTVTFCPVAQPGIPAGLVGEQPPNPQLIGTLVRFYPDKCCRQEGAQQFQEEEHNVLLQSVPFFLGGGEYQLQKHPLHPDCSQMGLKIMEKSTVSPETTFNSTKCKNLVSDLGPHTASFNQHTKNQKIPIHFILAS